VKSRTAPKKTQAAKRATAAKPKKPASVKAKPKPAPKKMPAAEKSKPAPKKMPAAKKSKPAPKKRLAAKKSKPAPGKKKAASAKTKSPSASLLTLVETLLDDGKAVDVVVIDLAGKSDMADFMVVASGGSGRQINALAERLIRGIKTAKLGTPGVEGLSQGDWVLLDAGDVIVHLFRPEIRAFYNLEKMWAVALPDDGHNTALGG
jgi:ribosome-associated protein